METSLPKFSRAAQKILVAQNLGGLQPPSPPPARTPMLISLPYNPVSIILKLKGHIKQRIIVRISIFLKKSIERSQNYSFVC